MMFLVRVELVDVHFVSVYVIKYRVTVTVCLLACKNVQRRVATRGVATGGILVFIPPKQISGYAPGGHLPGKPGKVGEFYIGQ